jgi:hypothetical protein
MGEDEGGGGQKEFGPPPLHRSTELTPKSPPARGGEVFGGFILKMLE